MSRAYRDALEIVAGMQSSTSDRKGLMFMVAAWDAAPSDPVALIPRGRCHAAMLDLLRALGMPGVPDTSTPEPSPPATGDTP